MRVLYRARQFFGGLTARVSDADRRAAAEILPPDARVWFRSLPRDLQWHGLHVMGDLRRAGFDQGDLLAAALLHDAGKAEASMGPIQRALVVMLRKLACRFAPDWIAQRSSLDWRLAHGIDRLLAVAAQHPQISADCAAQSGCSPLTIDLIRRHQDQLSDDDDDLLRALQQVDDRN